MRRSKADVGTEKLSEEDGRERGEGEKKKGGGLGRFAMLAARAEGIQLLIKKGSTS